MDEEVYLKIEMNESHKLKQEIKERWKRILSYSIPEEESYQFVFEKPKVFIPYLTHEYQFIKDNNTYGNKKENN